MSVYKCAGSMAVPLESGLRATAGSVGRKRTLRLVHGHEKIIL